MITRRTALSAVAGLAAAPLAACDRSFVNPHAQSAAPAALPASAAPAASSAPAVSAAPASSLATSSFAAAPPLASGTASGSWTRDAFLEAMAASDRPTKISEAAFQAIQARKPGAMANINRYLTERFGGADPKVLAAFEAIPREYYHYVYSEQVSQADRAYEAEAKPWPLGYGSVLSDYLGQAYMTQIAKPKPGEVSLEVGTGSGFQSSLLSRIVSQAYSIEIIEPIGKAVHKIFKPLGYDNIESRVGDGYYGWPEVKDGFDIIIVTCVAQYAPPELFRQLKPGGRLIIPIGQPFKRGQVLYVYAKDENGKIHSRRDVGVFFIPMTGAMMAKPAPEPGAAT